MDALRTVQDYEALRSELQACRRKLDSKCEALLILSRDLDLCRQERDQFKLMAEQVQARYQSIKRQLAGVGPRQSTMDGIDYSDMKHQSLAQLLCEMRDVNKSLQFEVDDFKQKLKDAHGDIKLLREQIARHRVGTTDEGMDTRHFPAHERVELVRQLEASREQFVQLQRDLQQVLDEKQELVTDRGAYRDKYERLNKELNYILKGDEKRVVDVDAIVMENRYLQERIRQVEEEKQMAMGTITKYKNILDKKKNKGILKLGQNRSGGVVISQKQVHQLLENRGCLTPTPQMMSDLQSLSTGLLEALNDKNTALTHQRKTNKILGLRVSELEKKLRTLEVGGLWSVPDKTCTLDKLRFECEAIKTMLPSAELSPSSTGADHPGTPEHAGLVSLTDNSDQEWAVKSQGAAVSTTSYLVDLGHLGNDEGSNDSTPVSSPPEHTTDSLGVTFSRHDATMDRDHTWSVVAGALESRLASLVSDAALRVTGHPTTPVHEREILLADDDVDDGDLQRNRTVRSCDISGTFANGAVENERKKGGGDHAAES